MDDSEYCPSWREYTIDLQVGGRTCLFPGPVLHKYVGGLKWYVSTVSHIFLRTTQITRAGQELHVLNSHHVVLRIRQAHDSLGNR